MSELSALSEPSALGDFLSGLSSAWAATSHIEVVAVVFGLVYIILAAKVARIVKCQQFFTPRCDFDLISANEFIDELCVVDDFILPTKCRILILQGMQAMWAGRYNSFWGYLIKQIDVRCRQFVKEEFIPSTSGRVTGALFHLTQHCVIGSTLV